MLKRPCDNILLDAMCDCSHMHTHDINTQMRRHTSLISTHLDMHVVKHALPLRSNIHIALFFFPYAFCLFFSLLLLLDIITLHKAMALDGGADPGVYRAAVTVGSHMYLAFYRVFLPHEEIGKFR